jgi:hypothetical protein
MAKSKSKAKAKETKPERSEIIEQAVIYVQSVAAHHAGFEADPTDDSKYASGVSVARAEKALTKLNALSPWKGPHSKSCLSADELHAKAKVLGLMYGLTEHLDLNETEKAFIRLFAGEVQDFIAGHRVELI